MNKKLFFLLSFITLTFSTLSISQARMVVNFKNYCFSKHFKNYSVTYNFKEYPSKVIEGMMTITIDDDNKEPIEVGITGIRISSSKLALEYTNTTDDYSNLRFVKGNWIQSSSKGGIKTISIPFLVKNTKTKKYAFKKFLFEECK